MTAPAKAQNVLAPPAKRAIFVAVTVRSGAEDATKASNSHLALNTITDRDGISSTSATTWA